VVEIIYSDGDDFCRHDRHESFDTFARRGFAVEGWRAEDIAAKTEEFAVHNFGVKNLGVFLEPSNGSHKRGQPKTAARPLQG